MTAEPLAVHTSLSFLDAEFNRIKGSWFWKTYLRHLENQMTKHVELAMASATSPAENIRVAVAMASAYRTALNLPELIRIGQVTFAGQIIGDVPKRSVRAQEEEGDEDGPGEAG